MPVPLDALSLFGGLLSAILDVKEKTDKFKHTLDSLHSVLISITPVMKDIESIHQELGRPMEELETVLQKMDECTTFVYKCLKIHRLNCLKMARHQARLARLQETFMMHFTTVMVALILRDLVQNRRQTELHSTDTNLPGVCLPSVSNNAFVLMLTARDLHIVWGNTPRYWIFTPVQGFRPTEVAELINVCWLDIRGWIKTSRLSPNTTYGAYFVFKMRDGAYGFENRAIEVMVRVMVVGQEDYETKRTVYLVRSHDDSNAARVPLLAEPSSSATSRYPTETGNGWMEIELGEFFSPEGEDKTVEMALSEVNSGMWKSGMIVKGIEIRPKQTN